MISPVLYQYAPEFFTRLAQHISMAFSATLLALSIGVPTGIWIHRQKKATGIVLGLANIFQTIPSLALLAFLVPFIGIGFKPTIIALTLYALLPIVRNTFIGLSKVSADYIEAVNALGFTQWQRLCVVELPLSLPVILSGIRISVTITIGITTIAAFIGAGGMGDFITSGLALSNPQLILLGAIPIALLALTVDFTIGYFGKLADARKKFPSLWSKIQFALALSVILILLSVIIISLFFQFNQKHRPMITIAAKNFTEQYLLADIMKQVIESHTTLKVKETSNLATTPIIQAAMQRGEVDLYAEYTGTAYFITLKQKNILTSKQTYDRVKKAYQQLYQLTWLAPFGFSNSETLAVTKIFAKQHKLKNFSQLVPLSPQLTIAAPAEFLSRPDGYPLLKETYGFQFQRVLQMQPNLMYQSIAHAAVQVISAFSTDGHIKQYQLTLLQDNKKIYPPYDAAPVIRSQTLKKYPEVGNALQLLAGKIDQATMVNLNYRVDVKKIPPEIVAHQFLMEKHLL